MQKLDKFVQVHNILDKRNIKETNYELKIQGKKTLTLFPEGNTQQIWYFIENASRNLFTETSLKKSNTIEMRR